MTPDYGGSLIVSPGMPAVECRVTAPGDPGTAAGSADYGALSYAAWSLGLSDLWGDRPALSDEAVMSYSAVFGCVRAITNSFVSMGWHNYERDGKTKVELADDVSWLLDMQASPEMSALDWRSVMVKDALLRGNGYSEIERLGSGRPAWLWHLAEQRVKTVRDESGNLWYRVDNGPGVDPSYLPPANVYHLRGPSPDGLVGWSMVRLMRVAIDLGLKEERYGLDFFSRGPMPGGTVTIPGNMNKEQRAEFRRSFEQLYSGAANQHRIVVLSNGVTFTPASLPNDDAQFNESRVLQINEICRFFGVPPHKLADLTRATYSNVEEQERAYVTDCILPWARRFEAEADLKLYGRTNRGRRFTRFNLDALMRGNSLTQTTTVTQKVAGGLMTPNEGREYFDLNPAGAEGDVLLVQGAMVPLERAVNPPEPPAPPAPPQTPPSQNGNGKPETNGAAGGSARRPFPALDYSEDQERDDHGRFGSGSGDEGDSQDHEAAAQEKRDEEDHDLQQAREAEDQKTQDERDAEDAAFDEQEQETADRFAAEDEAAQEKRDEEDAAASERREQEDRDRQDEREARDAAREKEDAQTQAARDKEDADHLAGRDKAENDYLDSEESKAASDAEVERKMDEITREFEKREEQTQKARDKEDAQTDRAREKEDARMEKEDAAREKARGKEDREIDRTREKEDAARQARRDREEAANVRERDQAEKAREKEDRATEKAREEEDGKIERQRREEDTKAGAKS